VFDKVERTVGRPLEDVVGSSRYVDTMLTVKKVPRAAGGAVFRTVDRGMGRVLHLVNVPTRGDVRRLSRQLTVLTSEVRALSAATREHGATTAPEHAEEAEEAEDRA
jgi:hypothetical protein